MSASRRRAGASGASRASASAWALRMTIAFSGAPRECLSASASRSRASRAPVARAVRACAASSASSSASTVHTPAACSRGRSWGSSGSSRASHVSCGSQATTSPSCGARGRVHSDSTSCARPAGRHRAGGRTRAQRARRWSGMSRDLVHRVLLVAWMSRTACAPARLVRTLLGEHLKRPSRRWQRHRGVAHGQRDRAPPARHRVRPARARLAPIAPPSSSPISASAFSCASGGLR